MLNWLIRRWVERYFTEQKISEILDACAPRVAPGGLLVYSTCSNESEENDQQVTAFLERHPEFSLADSRESIPFESGTDGAFAARLRRNPA